MAKHFQVDTNGTLTTSLLSYWKFDSDMTDFYGSNNGSVGGGSATYGTGKINSDWNANGSNWITLGTIPSSLQLTGDRSISLWINTSYTANDHYILDCYDGTGSYGYSFGMKWDGSGVLNYSHNGNWVFGNSSCATGSWVHVIVVVSSGTVTFYVNGSSNGGGSLSANTISGAATAKIADSYNSKIWHGQIDEMAIWGKALSSQEIADLYNGGSGQTMVNSMAYSRTMSDAILIGASRTASAARIGTFSRTVSASIMNGASRYASVGKGLIRSMSDSIMNAASRFASVTSTKAFLRTMSDAITNGASRFAAVTRIGMFIRSISDSVMNGATRFATVSGVKTIIAVLSDSMMNARGRLAYAKAYVDGLLIQFMAKYTPQGTSFSDKYQKQNTVFEDKYH